jgi:putative tricarboxylic transport membrane protein
MRGMTTMKRIYQSTAIVILALSAFVAYESLQLKYYTSLGPGPGFFPFWLSLVLSVLAVTMFYQATFRKSDPKPQDFYDSRTGYLRMLAICAGWIWVTAMMQPLGFRLTMAVFLPALLMTLGRVRWYLVIALTLLGSIIAYWLFNNVMRASLPVGPADGIFEAIDNFLSEVFLRTTS